MQFYHQCDQVSGESCLRVSRRHLLLTVASTPLVPGAARATALSSLSAGQSIIKEIYNLEERAFYDRSLHAALINIFTVNYPLCTRRKRANYEC